MFFATFRIKWTCSPHTVICQVNRGQKLKLRFSVYKQVRDYEWLCEIFSWGVNCLNHYWIMPLSMMASLTFFPLDIVRRANIQTGLFEPQPTLRLFAMGGRWRSYFPIGFSVMWAWESLCHDWNSHSNPLYYCVGPIHHSISYSLLPSHVNEKRRYLRQQLAPSCFFQSTPFWHCIFIFSEHNSKQDGQTISELDTPWKDKSEVRL